MARARLVLPLVLGGALLMLATTAVEAVPLAAVASSVSGAPIVGLRQSTSTNWSGYAAYNQTFTSVTGSWKQPAVTCGSQNTYSSYWAGLDGYNSNSVEQTGTEADCSGGVATYYSWYEIYPHPSYYASVTVRPGDSYTATITYASGWFNLQLVDTTTGQSFSTRQKMNSAKRSSAEVVLEAPYSGGILPLANFGTASFSGSYAIVNGTKTALGSLSPLDPITMVNPAGMKATPSAFDATKTAFSVLYSSS